MQIMQDFLKHVLIYALKDRNRTNIEHMAARYLWFCKWSYKNWFVYPIGNMRIQNSIKCLVGRFKWKSTRFLWMSWKISPVDKHSFPKYVIYFRIAIYSQLCQDDMSMVKRSAASNLGSLLLLLKLLIQRLTSCQYLRIWYRMIKIPLGYWLYKVAQFFRKEPSDWEIWLHYNRPKKKKLLKIDGRVQNKIWMHVV